MASGRHTRDIGRLAAHMRARETPAATRRPKESPSQTRSAVLPVSEHTEIMTLSRHHDARRSTIPYATEFGVIGEYFYERRERASGEDEEPVPASGLGEVVRQVLHVISPRRER